MSKYTTITENDGSEHIHCGQIVRLGKKRFEFFHFFSIFHIFFNCLTGIKISNLFFTNVSLSTLLFDHKNAVPMMDLRCVERQKIPSPPIFRWFSPYPPSLPVVFHSLPMPCAAFPFVAVVASPMPCLDSPCLALPCLALPYLLLPCLA